MLTDWESRRSVTARVTGARLGDMKVPRDFERALRGAGLGIAAWAGGRQTHGVRVGVVRRPTAPRERPNTDALWTDRPGVALRVFTADCAPIFLLDARGRRAALIHAGRRGIAAGILSRAVAVGRRRWGLRTKDLRAAVGPHIRACCYEVGEDVARDFVDTPGAVARVRAGRARLDLSRVLRHQARRLGLRDVAVAPWCTACDRRFHSYRREKTERRQAAILCLTEERHDHRK
ncbi:MAG: laccase domain-containing protein [Elusimicrobia bacterium]|nr:MAG: laccase domain-containing protein [Elusimicrobiota bacterium]